MRCRRIFIERRLVETGSKPTSEGWKPTSSWSFRSVEEMSAALEDRYPGFKLAANHGQGDRDRHILEFKRAAARLAPGGAND